MFPVNLISRFNSFPAYADMRLVEDDFENRLTKYFKSDYCWLDEREQKIIWKFFKEEKTLQKIGDELYITRERVRQIIARSVEKLDYMNSKFKFFYDDDQSIEKLCKEKEIKSAALTEEILKLDRALEQSRTMYFNDETTLGEIRKFLSSYEGYDQIINITDLNFSVRTTNCLCRAYIKNIIDLTLRSEEDLMNLKNFGKKCLIEVKTKLKELGLSLREE